ncbi:MAG: ATP-binding protein [Saprospiraceae bacterium]
MELVPIILFGNAVIHVTRKILETSVRLPEWDKVLSKVWVGSILYFLLALIPWLHFIDEWFGEIIYLLLLVTVYLLRDYNPARMFSIALLPYAGISVLVAIVRYVAPSFYETYDGYFGTAEGFSVLWLIGFGIYAFIQNNKERKQRRKEEEQIRAAEARKAELEHLVVARTTELTAQKEELEKTLAELKSAQTQLVHSEKMASLGELTAGIAHEIQNPLNFVNNFSELSLELAQELKEAVEKPEMDTALVLDLARDLAQNQEKINHHGKRAANIVTAMLQHSRTSTGKKEPTDLNVLADEYLRLAYHGLRAKDKNFNAGMVTDFDPAIDKVDIIPQDFGRVLLNLINNAFYAVTQRKNQAPEGYEPTVTVSTRLLKSDMVEIRIQDNGTGIPKDLKAKIFQPFFTTKPTGQGTGLGLSLAFDIVTKGHSGTLEVDSTEGHGTTFVIRLPH